jgi:hypothetical protein
MTRFLELPFENWTKVGAQLHGTVMLYVDPGLPVAQLRAELERITADEPLWDGRTCVVHVTDADARAMTVRVLVSSRTAGDLFALRAKVRERLLGWLATYQGGTYMPRVRIEEPKLLQAMAETVTRT